MIKLSKRITAMFLAMLIITTMGLSVQFSAAAEDVAAQTDIQSFDSEESDGADIIITFIRADGSSEQRRTESGEYIGSLPENTAAYCIENTDSHSVFSWGDINESSVFFSDEEITETEETESCSFDESGVCVVCNNKAENVAESEIISENTDEVKPGAGGKISFKAPSSVLLSSSSEVDFSALRKIYSKVNAFLLALDNKGAQYSADSMNNLITLMSDANIATYLGAEDLSGFDSSDQERADELAQNISQAFDSLELSIGELDVSAYAAAAQSINNLDLDAYDKTRSIDSAVRISNLLIKCTTVTYTDITNSENVSKIKLPGSAATQQNVDDATRTMLDALYVSVKVYTITTDSGVTEVSFQNGTTTGDTSPYTATYASNVIAHSEDENTAWYMDFNSESTSRGKQLQGFGETFITKVVGNLNIYAEKRSAATPNLIRIYRKYSNHPEANPIQEVDFVDGSYILPTPPAITCYDFDGFAVNGDTSNLKMPGEEIAITGDTIINAMYTFNGTASCAINATALENGEGFNGSVAYNTKIEIKGGDSAYGWVETVDSASGKYRPFAIGSDIIFFATESVELTAVTEAEFNAYNFSIPAISMRKEGVIISDGKVFFNGQVIDKNLVIKEYGVVLGVSTNGENVDPKYVTVDNVGSFDGYNVFRAKATKPIGANQFSISINGLAGKNYTYKGYLIYQKSAGEYITIYTDAF